MAIRPIIILPDPRLRLISEPVARVDDAVRALADDMLDTMYDAPGIGLAAIQIAEPRRLIVIDVARKDEPRQPLVMVNPKIVADGGEATPYEEGCLSIPDYYEEVTRPGEVVVRFLDREGREQEMKADGLLAVCIQHEIDHLDGVLFIDRISKLKRDRVVKKFQKLARREV